LTWNIFRFCASRFGSNCRLCSNGRREHSHLHAEISTRRRIGDRSEVHRQYIRGGDDSIVSLAFFLLPFGTERNGISLLIAWPRRPEAKETMSSEVRVPSLPVRSPVRLLHGTKLDSAPGLRRCSPPFPSSQTGRDRSLSPCWLLPRLCSALPGCPRPRVQTLLGTRFVFSGTCRYPLGGWVNGED